MEKESIEKIETKEEKMEKSEKPEWLKEVEGKLAGDSGLYQGLEKISELPNAEQLVTKEELEELEELKELSKSDLQKNLQEEFEQLLTFGHGSQGVEEVEKRASEKGIKLELKKELLQKGFESALTIGYRSGIEEIENYASEKGIELELKKELLQKGFEGILPYEGIGEAEKIEAYAAEKGIELNLKEGLQKGFVETLARRIIEFAEKIEAYAAEKGIELNFKEEELQKAFEQRLAQGLINDFEELKNYAAEKGIELKLSKGIKNIIEESYIRMIHNPEEMHVEVQRNRLIEEAREKGIELDYDKVVKMDYLDFLEVPKKDRLEQEKEVKIGDVALESKFYGQIKENKCKGKFILAENPETKEVKFIFDATLGEHKDIGAKYDVDVIGGGWLEIDKENKKITINKKSQDFGYEPRMISAAVIVKNFPDYEIEVEE